ncbi:MAG: sigma factor-like helix-turn-helix DNA-binding protein [Acidimicrobiales bacterium]|jgi:RNA polymerase sigma-70 factor (ECF subfamily)
MRRRSTERRRRLRVREGVEDTLPDPDLHKALAALSDEYRDVVVLRFFVGLTVAETAKALHLGQGTVKSRLARALSHLEKSPVLDLGDSESSDLSPTTEEPS